jgi:hypothetical protein
MVTVLFVELTLIQFQTVHVLLIISQICIKEEKFAKFVTSHVTTVIIFFIIVLIVLLVPEDLVPHNVTVHLDT